MQTAVDTEHHLIVSHQVTNVGTDRSQLAHIAKRTKAASETNKLAVIADRGYYKSEEILACDKVGITVTLPKPQTSNNKARGQFDRQDFVYLVDEDVYRCPAGEHLIYRFTGHERGLNLDRYWTHVCQNCAIKDQCTTAKERRVIPECIERDSSNQSRRPGCNAARSAALLVRGPCRQ